MREKVTKRDSVLEVEEIAKEESAEKQENKETEPPAQL